MPRSTAKRASPPQAVWTDGGGLPAPLCSPACAPVFEPVALPLWRELSTGLTWLQLRLSPVYYGRFSLRGNRSPVVVVPGFLQSDLYLADLYFWLRRIGYTPFFSDIGRNADCPDVLLERLIETVDAVHRQSGRKVQLIGHSFGGVLARAAAAERPEMVSQVIALGSPIRALRAHRWVLEAARAMGRVLPSPASRPRRHGDHDHSRECACEFLHKKRDRWPPEVRRAAIYTKGDGVVDWRVCLDEDESRNFEVHGSHTALVFNEEVYRLLARLLAEVEDRTEKEAASEIGTAAGR